MGMYKQDPNDSKKQVPNIQGSNRFDKAVNVQTCSLQKTPSYVLVNTTLTTPCGFFFGDSASFADLGNAASQSISSHYTTMLDDATAGTKLNIHPIAWSGSAADAGSITFVYKSGLSTGGF